jgi:hypothetical protein
MLLPPYRRAGDIKLNGLFINRLVHNYGYAIANFNGGGGLTWYGCLNACCHKGITPVAAIGFNCFDA